MKTTTTSDARTGDTLQLSYDPQTKTYLINGISVVRKPPLEDQEDEYIFGPRTEGPSMLYHLTRQQLEYLKSLPDSPD